ncbi:MAG: tetratricopeptide repeat protein [Terrimicrobiaceae bacterium]
MEPPDSEKPNLSVPTRAKIGKSSKKKKKRSSADSPLSLVKSPDNRKDFKKEQQKHESNQKAEISTGDGDSSVLRQVADHASPHAPKGGRHRRRRSSLAKFLRRFRLLRFYRKLAGRKIRRFHARFTPRQIIGFYFGVPAALSLILCLYFFLAKPPRGVTPDMVSRRKPAISELIQQIQADLHGHDPKAALSTAAALEKNYPDDPRTYVAKGTAFARKKDYDEARKSYLHALELAKDLLPALINLGEIEFSSGNYGQAVGYYEQAGQRLPRNPLIMFRRYLCYSLLNEQSKTAGMMKELGTRPDSVEWYFVQASEALHAGKKSEAQRLITAAGTLYGEQAVAYQETLRKIGWLK